MNTRKFSRSYSCTPFPGIQIGSGGLLHIPGEALETLAFEAFSRLSFTFTQKHLISLMDIARDRQREYSENDRCTAAFLLKNALTASRGVLPLCQDTGIAAVFGWKGSAVLTGGGDEEAASLTSGIRRAYKERNLRFSTVRASSFFDEYDPGDNLPAQLSLFSSVPDGFLPYREIGDRAFHTDNSDNSGAEEEERYRFLFCAKGGGSSNKTSFTQGTKALLAPEPFGEFLAAQISALGTAACPPYTIAVAVGGLSPEQNLLILKLATAGLYDDIPPGEAPAGEAPFMEGVQFFRDSFWERRVLEIAADTGLGAQFGGRALASEAVVLRLPRHGASCPVSVGVSCSAHRNLRGFIDRRGLFLEETVQNPAALEGFEEALRPLELTSVPAPHISLDHGIEAALEELSRFSPGERVLLSGKILVARDAAHARWHRAVEGGEELPAYTTRYPICYAGPSETPPGMVTGSLGPTTAGRMDSYAEMLMSRGAALITIAKGNRGSQWAAACAKWGAIYLGAIGGAAALTADEHILSSEVLDYPELGMEAVRLVEIRNLPVFILIDRRGAEFRGSNVKKSEF